MIGDAVLCSLANITSLIDKVGEATTTTTTEMSVFKGV